MDPVLVRLSEENAALSEEVLSVGIAYGSPVREAMNLLDEAAKENQDLLDDPAPTVIFETFGDNSPWACYCAASSTLSSSAIWS